MNNIFWTGYSNHERLSSINAITSIVSKFGDIVDYKLFSDISLTMTIEMEEAKINSLYDDLKHIISMDAFDYINSVSSKERTIYLNVSFSSGTGNLKIEMPAVPGWNNWGFTFYPLSDIDEVKDQSSASDSVQVMTDIAGKKMAVHSTN